MKLAEFNNSNKQEWIEKGYTLYDFDREKVMEETKSRPNWVHFGPGNIFRAYLAKLQQKLLDQNIEDKGIIVAEGFDYEIIDKVYRPLDNLFLDVTLHADGAIDKTVVGSIVESLVMDMEKKDWDRLEEIFTSESLQIASFTITEKGYNLKNQNGDFFSYVLDDFVHGPDRASGYIGKVTSLCYQRYLSGDFPISFVSMDNCSKNGDRLYQAIHIYAQEWEKRGLVKEGFVAYVNDKSKVGFPWSMIDKITPHPSEDIVSILKKDGFEDTELIGSTNGSSIAAFVNAEETEYLIVEEWFPNGRPKLEKGGAIFTSRETVEKVERMKVCTCLNPLHTALAVFGCLLDYKLISDEMKDPDLRKLVEIIGYQEGLPVVTNPGIINPEEFMDTVLNVRFPNVFIPDTPQRIATDTSQKLAIRFGETIKSYLSREDLSVVDLKLIPFVFAGWIRYLLAVDDNGQAFALSPDPMLNDLHKYIEGIKLGDAGSFSEKLKLILSNKSIFGVDLYEVGLGELVEKYFNEMVAGKGAVRKTLKKYVTNAIGVVHEVTRTSDAGLEDAILESALAKSLQSYQETYGKPLRKVLLLPPDLTRYHSGTGKLTNLYYKMLSDSCQVDIMPALGTHMAMTDQELTEMFGDTIPKERFLVHNWRDDVVSIGQVPSSFVRQVSDGLIEYEIEVQVNKRLVDPSYDLIISLGQVVPHEVAGMANYTKNVLVGCGGFDMINKSHMLGAVYGMERMMGQADTPVREVFDYAEKHFLKDMSLLYVLTVTTQAQGNTLINGLFIGRSRNIFEQAVALSQQKNLAFVDEPFKKVVVYLEPTEFKSTWLGNKSVYRTRMAIADDGDLIVLAPGVRQFGEDPENDRFIRKYGYAGRDRILEMYQTEEGLKNNLSVAAHLIHGSSDGRFRITYAVEKLTRDEVEGVHFSYMPYQEAIEKYNPETLKDGFNTLEDGETIYYISNPALGLWALRKHFESSQRYHHD